MNDTRTKSLGPLEIKSEERGEVEAVICTLNVVDHDREVVLPGAIKDGTRVHLSAFGHGAVLGDAPVGKGTVHVVDDRALLRGQFYLTTQRGREAFETVKAMGTDSEWSIGFIPTKLGTMTKEWSALGAERLLAGIDLFECSPVLRGASPYTGTVAVKEAVKEGVKEAARDLDDEKKAEAEEESRRAEDAEMAKRTEEEKAESDRLEAARKAAEEAETKRLADEMALKARATEAMEEYERVQLTLGKLGYHR